MGIINNTPQEPLTDKSPMPWGKYQGEPMGWVPASYLIFLYDNNKCSGAVKAYIEENMDVLQHEVNQHKKKDQ